jgi:hypothetical protein
VRQESRDDGVVLNPQDVNGMPLERTVANDSEVARREVRVAGALVLADLRRRRPARVPPAVTSLCQISELLFLLGRNLHA